MTTNILLTLPPWLAYAIARDAIVLWEKIANSPTAGITITVFGVLSLIHI